MYLCVRTAQLRKARQFLVLAQISMIFKSLLDAKQTFQLTLILLKDLQHDCILNDFFYYFVQVQKNITSYTAVLQAMDEYIWIMEHCSALTIECTFSNKLSYWKSKIIR